MQLHLAHSMRRLTLAPVRALSSTTRLSVDPSPVVKPKAVRKPRATASIKKAVKAEDKAERHLKAPKAKKVAEKPPPKPKSIKLPKQITSIWTLYNAKEMKAAKDALPAGEKMSVISQAQENARKYHALSQAEKDELTKELEDVKAKFSVEYKAALEALTPEQIRAENSLRQARRKAGESTKANLRDPSKPRQPLNGYLLFLADRRDNSSWMSDLPSDTASQNIAIVKKAAAEWKTMSEDDKKPFLAQAAESKAVYEAEKKEWEASLTKA